MKKTAKPDKKPAKLKNIKFFSMPLVKLYVLSVLTFGLYDIYWFYRNWKAVRDDNTEKLSPFWRAILMVFYCWSLFGKITDSAKKHGYKPGYAPDGLAALYVIMLIAGNYLDRPTAAYSFWVSVTVIVLGLLSALVLLPIQKAINFNNSHVKNGNNVERNSRSEIAVIIPGLIIGALAYIGSFIPPAAEPVVSPEAQSAKVKVDALTAQYEKCSTELTEREKAIDNTSQEAVDGYNTDLQKCENVRVEQNAAADKYNSLIGR